MFHVGQRVICVNDTPACGGSKAEYDGLTKGQVYTVRDLSGPSWFDGAPTIRLMEIDRGDEEYKDDGYWAHRFRPFRETDISIFTAMLTPKKELV